MVVFLQLCLFVIAVSLRGRYLFGRHLRADSASGRLSYTARSKYGITARHVGIVQRNGIPFIVKSERWYHRLLKSIGIASEIRIASSEFDRKYFITTDYPTYLERTLGSGQLLSHLQELFALPVKSLHAMPNKIWCVIRKDDLQEADAHYEKHFALLDTISKSSSRSIGYDHGLVPSRLGVMAFLCVCVHAGLLTLGIFGIFPTLADSVDVVDTLAWVLKGIMAGSAAAAIWLFLILNIFRGSSWICWVFADFVLCGLLGFVLSGIFVVREANIHLPQPPPQVYGQPIMQKTCILECKRSCGRRCTQRSSYPFHSDASCNPQSRAAIMQEKRQADHICRSSAWYEYTIQVRHWQKLSHYSFSPDVSLFDSVRVGDFLNVPVHERALRLEWVDTDSIQVR